MNLQMKKPIVKNSVQELRKERGATQEELAEAVGVTRQTIIAIEKGNYTPSVALAPGHQRFFQCAAGKSFPN